MALPPLYSEPLFPRATVVGIDDSDVIPLRGYRRYPMWGCVPVFTRFRWTPATFGAWLEARAKVFPGVEAWRKATLAAADRLLPHAWPVPDFGPPAHDQLYRCHDCGCWLQGATPVSLRKHVCPKCGKVFEGNETRR